MSLIGQRGEKGVQDKEERGKIREKKEIMGVQKENKTAKSSRGVNIGRRGYGLRTDIQTPVSCCQSPGPTVAAKD